MHFPSTLSIAIALALNFTLGGAAYFARTVDRGGLVSGWIIGSIISVTMGLPGWLSLALMFAIGSAATKWGYAAKAQRGIAQSKGGRRGWQNAVANCLVAVVCAVIYALSSYGGYPEMALMGFLGALATATMDTVSSELGPIYGKDTIVLPTCRSVPPGTEGGISAAGTLLGLAGAVLFILGTSFLSTMSTWIPGTVPPAEHHGAYSTIETMGAAFWLIPVICVAATIGTFVESLLAATGIGRSEMGSAFLNVINTAVGAGVMALWLLSIMMAVGRS